MPATEHVGEGASPSAIGSRGCGKVGNGTWTGPEEDTGYQETKPVAEVEGQGYQNQLPSHSANTRQFRSPDTCLRPTSKQAAMFTIPPTGTRPLVRGGPACFWSIHRTVKHPIGERVEQAGHSISEHLPPSRHRRGPLRFTEGCGTSVTSDFAICRCR